MAWKHVDNTFPLFKKIRNIRLGLASDGFNPFGMQNVTYSCWPVILIPYNLPPWLYEKQSYWIMSMLIPGKKSPGMNIDVYLRTLIEELKELWNTGLIVGMLRRRTTLKKICMSLLSQGYRLFMVETWEEVLLHGTSSVFPLDHPWRMNKMSFNNEEETREAPVLLSGQAVLDQYATFDQVKFGKDISKKRNRDEDARWHNWRKKSIFLSSPTGLLCS
jgi:hypothetical protein